MSRILADESIFMDIEWYGVDKKGNIAVFCSAGKGNLPEFVCENKERTNTIIRHFETFDKTAESVLYFKSIKCAEEVARNFSDKGLYYFDSDDGTKHGISTLRNYYTKLSAPQKPLKYMSLPEPIKQLLKFNFMDVEDFSSVNTVYVKHAYT